MDKKAMEVQFNWIFVLIVGAIILFFFITLAGRQKEVSGKQESLAVLDALETSISGQKASADREDVLHQRSAFDLELFCEDKVKLSSKQSGFSRSLQNVVAFGPSVMAANDLLTMTKA